MRLVLTWLAATLLTFVATLALGFAALGLAPVRAWMEQLASDRLGRTVEVRGGWTLRPGRTLVFTARDLRVANAEWGREPDLLAAGAVEIQVDALSLLNRPVHVRRIAVDGLDLLLEQDERGRRNWEMGAPEQPKDWAWLDELPLVLEEVTFPGSRVRLAGPRLVKPLELRFTTFDQRLQQDGTLAVMIDGTANDAPARLQGSLGPVRALLRSQDFRFAFDGSVGEIALALSGDVDDLAKPVDSRMDFRVQAPEAAYLLERFGIRGLGNGPIELRGTLQPAAASGEEGLTGQLTGVVGDLKVAAEGELVDPAKPGRLTVQLDVAGPDLSLIGDIARLPALPADPFRLQVELDRQGDTLEIRPSRLEQDQDVLTVQGRIGQLATLRETDVTFRLEGRDVARLRGFLGLPGTATGKYRVDGRLKQRPDKDEWLELRGDIPLGRFEVEGPVGPAPDYFGTSLKASASGPDLRRVGNVFRKNLPQGPFNGTGDLQWTDAGLKLTKVQVRQGPDSALLNGTIGGKPWGSRMDLDFKLSGRDLAALAWLLPGKPDTSAWPKGRYDTQGRWRSQPGRQRMDRFSLAVAGARLELNGRLGRGKALAGTDLKFRADGSDLAAFRKLAGRPNLPKGPFKANGAIVLTPQLLSLRDVDFSAGGTDGSITGEFGRPDPLAAGKVDLAMNGSDITPWLVRLGDSATRAEPFTLVAKGQWTADRWSADVLRLTTPAGRLEISGSALGRLAEVADASAKGMALTAQTTDLSAAGRAVGLKLPALPLNLTGRFTGTRRELTVDQIVGTFGESDIAGSLTASLPAPGRGQKVPRFDIRLDSRLVDVRPFLAQPGEKPGEAPATSPRTRYLPDIHLPVRWLDGAVGRIAWKADTVRLAARDLTRVEVNAASGAGQLRFAPVRFHSADGSFDAELTVRRTATAPIWTAVVTGDQVRFVAPSERGDEGSLYTVRLNVAGTGDNLRTVASTLNGQVRITGAGGWVSSSKLDALFSDFFRQLVVALNPMITKKKRTEIVCSAILFEAKDGILDTSPAVVLRTGDVDVVGHGTVNLATEAIDFNFKTAARKGMRLSAGDLINPYIKVTGTLTKPHLTLDPKGVLVNGGAAFATAGLSIVATTLWDRVVKGRDPCATATKEADRRAAAR